MNIITRFFTRQAGRRPALRRVILGCALCAVALLPLCTAPAADLQDGSGTVYSTISAFSASALTICSNMTTNVSALVSPMRFQRGQGIGLAATFKSVTNEATALKVSGWQVSTNKPGDSATNWFDLMPPGTTLTFTNHSGITAQAQWALLPPTTIDNVNQVRFTTVQNTSTTNNCTNVVFTGTTFLPTQ